MCDMIAATENEASKIHIINVSTSSMAGVHEENGGVEGIVSGGPEVMTPPVGRIPNVAKTNDTKMIIANAIAAESINSVFCRDMHLELQIRLRATRQPSGNVQNQ